MRITKCLLIVFFISIMLFLIPSISNAAVEYTRTFPANDGTINLNLTGLTLDENKAYSFALVTKGGMSTDTKWHTLTEYTATTVKVNLNSSTADIRDVFRIADTGYLYIKDNSTTDGSYVVDGLQVDLKLPYLQSLPYSYTGTYYYVDSIYGMGGAHASKHVQFNKVTDKKIIEKYLDIKNNNKSITELASILPSAPIDGYSQTGSIYEGGKCNDRIISFMGKSYRK